MLTFGSLFAGIGGFDLGFERAGMVCKWQVEIDDYGKKVLKKHWPDVPRWDDVRTFPPKGDWTVDVICGGFPCQDISYAGRGAGLQGEKSGLFFEVARIVGEMGPRIVVLENVAALLTRGIDAVLGTLASLGYDAEWHCIPAAAFALPHNRNRIFIVANSEGIGPIFNTAEMGVPQKDVETQGRFWKGQVESAFAGHGYCPDSDDWRIDDGFPGWMDRLRGIGNAVAPPVAEWIGRRIVESINQ